MQRSRSQWALTLVLLLAVGGAYADEPRGASQKKDAPKQEDEKYVSGWMKLKLEYSQNILAGIAAADHDAVVQNAEAMKGLSKVEGFIRRKVPGYTLQLDIFNDANDELIRYGQRENLEGTALAFTQMTLSCVNCHRRLREHER